MKPRRQWNVYRIKSPWLRIPVAFVIALAGVPLVALVIILSVGCAALRGAWEEARTEFIHCWKGCDWSAMWRAITDPTQPKRPARRTP